MNKLTVLLILVISLISPQLKAQVIANISTDQILIDYNFKGQYITVSGIIDEGEDLIITVEGPSKTYRIWKKEKIDGIWINSKNLVIPKAHSYFFIASTKDVTSSKNYLNLLNLEYQDHDIQSTKECDSKQHDDFLHQFKLFRQQEMIYTYDLQNIEMVNSNIFKTELFIPQSASAGIYDVNVYSFINGKESKHLTLNFTINKQGLYAEIDYLSKNHPLKYSIFSVFIALIIAAFAGFIFRKDR